MKFRNLFFAGLMLLPTLANAQLIMGNAFLQGHYLEIGMDGNGSFGACTYVPASYHPHVSFGNDLAEVYDYGHDGWTVGTPPYMGDYTYPGNPYEGWELQCTRGKVQGYQSCTGHYNISGTTMTGSITSYTHTAGRVRADWDGVTMGGDLRMNMVTYIDTEASWVTMVVKLVNIGATPIDSIYYQRSTDPDIDETWPGGSFGNGGLIAYQNDALHRVMVSSNGVIPLSVYPYYPYFALGAIDNRAVAFCYHDWPLSLTLDLKTIYDGTAPGTVTLLGHRPSTGDNAIGIVFNLGTLNPGDSTTFSYAYIFNDSSGLDSAFLSVGTLGLPEKTSPATKFKIYPNPSSDQLNIDIENDGYSSYTLTNAMGQEMMSQPLTGNTTKVDVASLASGVYYITLRGKDGVKVEKWVKW